MHHRSLIVLVLLVGLAAPAWATPATQTGIALKLAAAGITNTEIKLNVPIVIPTADNPFEETETTLWGTLICPNKGAAKLPTILITTAYRHEFMTVIGIPMLKHGYNLLCVDCRGQGSSGGAWTMLDPVEHYDLAYIVDKWIPAQSWSNGLIGMYGPSYMAITQMQTMGLIERDPSGTPTHLKAAFPETSMADAYHDICCPGGNFNIEFGLIWVSMTDALSLMLPLQILDLGLMFNDINEPFEVWYEHFNAASDGLEAIVQPGNDRYSSWYQRKSPMIYWPDGRDEGLPNGDGATCISSKLPVFLSGGWFDIFTSGTLKNYTHGLKKHAPGDKALVMGEWYHLGASFMTEIASATSGELPARWFDWKIKGRDDGFMHEFPVVMKVLGDGRWRAEKSWPLPESRLEAKTLYLSKAEAEVIDGDWYTADTDNPCLSLTENPSTADYSGTNPLMLHAATRDYLHGRHSRSIVRWSMGASAILPLGDVNDERRDEIGVPTFSSEPLAEDLEITGPLTLRFWAKTKFEGPAATLKPQALMALINKRFGLESNMFEEQMNEKTVQWIVELNDVFEDGQARNITSGWLRASHRPYNPKQPTALDPGYTPFDPYYTYPDRFPHAISANTVYEYVVELWPTCNVFKKGHRVRVSLSGSDFPHLFPLLTPSINEIVIDQDHRAALKFTTVNQAGEGRTWKWLGDSDDVSDYLMDHRDNLADATSESFYKSGDGQSTGAAATTEQDGEASPSSAGGFLAGSDGGRCFISSALRL